jgi:signal transduction histidine kinase
LSSGERLYPRHLPAARYASILTPYGGSPSVSQLGNFIGSEREHITQRWTDQLFATTASESLSREAVIDRLGEFLDELSEALRREQRFPQHTDTTITSPTATGHGKQRFELGYDIATVIREYGTLRDVLFQLLDERGVTPSALELRVLSKYLHSAIADAATQYALERDEQLREQASQHMSFLAHELRNPLASARLALATLERQGLLPKARHVEIINRSLGQVSDLIDDALTEIRLRSVRPSQLEPVDVAELLRQLTDESAVDAETRGLQLKIEAPAGLRVIADRKMLHSALSNLVRNAVKFSREGGSIRVRARESAKRVLLEVEDECGGLPDGKVQSLFDPFVQVGKDRSGFGLGLAIAKQATEAHGGQLRVHNLPGKGCIFVLDMPTDPSPVEE